MNEKWFALSISDIEKKLKTNAATGLSRKAARSAWYKYFPNARTFFIRKRKSVGKMLGETVADFAVIILMLAALFAVFFDELATGVTVLAVCLFSTAVATVLYVRAQRTMEQMTAYFLPTANVIRGGKLYRVNFDNVVPGDVIIVQRGDIVPGDARLITSDSLKVSMRCGQKKYISLTKQAAGRIEDNENNPQKLVNVLHAGSIITGGSGRAIVYATGRFTYLGAMTGGISELYNDNIPAELKNMRRVCSRLSFFSMLCIMPFSILSLLLSHMHGGTATLSSSFLTALALCASYMTQFSCTLCKIFFIKKIRELLHGKEPLSIRTTEAFDKLSELDYLFLLDGAALTDGVLHFESAFSAEGNVKSFDNPTATARLIFEMAALYSTAETNALTLGINLPERYKNGLDELFSASRVDFAALKIKYQINSYMQGTDTDPVDRVYYSEHGRKAVLEVYKSEKIFSQCSHAVIAGQPQPINGVGADKLKHEYIMHTSKGKTVLALALSPLENGGKLTSKLFIGAIVLGERTDQNALSGISKLEKKGIRVLSFVGGNSDYNVPQIPIQVQVGAKAYKDDFQRHALPLTYKFGEISTYYGLTENDIETLLDFAHSQNKSVGVMGFSDFAPNVIKKSDIFVSCAQLINAENVKSEKELYSLELVGAYTSTSCMQSVKTKADILIPRPNGRNGGISALVSALSCAETACRNLYGFFRYMLSAQLLRILTVALPMAVGKPILDARHVLLCSFIIDIFVLLILAFDNASTSRSVKQFKIRSLKEILRTNRTLNLCTVIASVGALLLPLLMNMLGIFGAYLYRVEYLFCAVLWLHLILIYCVRYGTVFNVRNAIKNKLFVALLVFAVVFVALTKIIPAFGLIFEIVSYPLAYFIASFVPAVIFSFSYELLSRNNKLK